MVNPSPGNAWRGAAAANWSSSWAAGEHKPEATEEPEGSVYGSCEEAEAAGRRGCRAAGAVDGVSRRRRCSM